MMRSILALIFFLISVSSVFAEDECDKNCKNSDYFCSKQHKKDYLWRANTYYINENTKIMEMFRYRQSCSTGEDIGWREICYVLFHKPDNKWIPVSISCLPLNDFIFRGYIEDIQRVKVKDKLGRRRIVEVITGQKRIRMEAEQKFFFDMDDYKDINPTGYGIYHSLDELKKKGYTILEIIDEKKKQKKAKEKK